MIPPEAHSRMEAKACAWYHITYHQSELNNKDESSEPMISFPWVIHERLCDIALRNNGRINRKSVRAPLEQIVDNTLNIIDNDNHFYQGTSDHSDDIEDDIKVLRQRVDDGGLW